MADERPDAGPDPGAVMSVMSVPGCVCECIGSFGGVEGGWPSFNCGCFGGGGGGVLGL